MARSPGMLPLMLEALDALHPNVGKSLKTSIDALSTDDEKADLFYLQFKTTVKSKGIFAQELAARIENANLEPKAVPEYIRRALQFLCVIAGEDDNEQSGDPSPTDSEPVAD